MNLPPSAELSPAQDVDMGLGDPLCYPYHDRLFASWVDWPNPAGLHKLLTWYTEGILGEKLNCEDPAIVYRLFPTAADFIRDLEKWWTNYNGLAMAKKMQLPPVLNLDSSPYRCKPLSMPTPYFPLAYLELKEKLLKK